MKRFVLGVILLSFLCSCNTEEHKNSENLDPVAKETGLIIRPSISMEVEMITRAESISIGDLKGLGYRLLLNDDVFEIPADGKITNIQTGTYTLTLTNSYEDLMEYVPAFDDPRFAATATVVIKEDELTDVDLMLTQANTGVRFKYNIESLEEYGMEDVIGSIFHGDGIYLVYDEDNRDETGYFAPRTSYIRFVLDGIILDFMDEEMEVIDLKPGQLWEVTVEMDETESNTGIRSLKASVANISESNVK